jgi:hypothetical protein
MKLNVSVVETALEKNGLTWWSTIIVADFIEIDFSIPVFNKWDANEHPHPLVGTFEKSEGCPL